MQPEFSQTELDNIAEEIRKERNRLLQESDFTQLPDSPLSEEQKKSLEFIQNKKHLHCLPELIPKIVYCTFF